MNASRRGVVAPVALVSALAVAVGTAVLAPGAGAAPVDCSTSSVESAPSLGATAARTTAQSVSVRVLQSTRTAAAVHRTGKRTWRARVHLTAKVRGTAARKVVVRIPATVRSTATAVCDGFTATVAMNASATGSASARISTGRVSTYKVTGIAHRSTKHSAVTVARRHAVAQAETREQRRARRAAEAASTAAVRREAAQVGGRTAADAARSAARTAAELAARRRGKPGPAPSSSASTAPGSTPAASETPSSVPSDAASPTSTPTVTVTASSSASATVTPATRPLLIKHGWDIPSPAFVQSHVASMEKQPFDGLTIVMPGLSNKVQSQTPESYDQFKQSLAPVAATRFTTLKHNFVMVYSAPAGDLFADWSVPVANFANMARAAKEAGFEGVFYDNEEYFGSALRYPGNCASHTVAQCQAQAQLRGRQVMDAMRAQWPAVRVLATYGPWVSDPLTASNLPGVPWNDVAWANPLSGPYVVGMIASAAGSDAKVIDGGEMYTPRTTAQFDTVKAWQKQGMAAKSAQVPASLRPVWSDTVSAAEAVYDQPWQGVGMDVGTWATTISNALASTDEYVWVYTELYDWWGSGWPATPVPAAWVDATRWARGS